MANKQQLEKDLYSLENQLGNIQRNAPKYEKSQRFKLKQSINDKIKKKKQQLGENQMTSVEKKLREAKLNIIPKTTIIKKLISDTKALLHTIEQIQKKYPDISEDLSDGLYNLKYIFLNRLDGVLLSLSKQALRGENKMTSSEKLREVIRKMIIGELKQQDPQTTTKKYSEPDTDKRNLMEDEEYQNFFKATLKKFGADSPDKLSDDKKKKFFDYIDKNWEAKKETNVDESGIKGMKWDKKKEKERKKEKWLKSVRQHNRAVGGNQSRYSPKELTK